MSLILLYQSTCKKFSKKNIVQRVLTFLQILGLKNVAQVLQCHVWTLCTDEYIANVAVEVHPGSDVSHLHVAIKSILTEVCLLSLVKIVLCSWKY